MTFATRIIAACLLPMLLAGCLLVPGKFNSSLTIHADRSFAFAYKGQLIANDPSESMNPSESPTTDSNPEAKAEAAMKAKEKAAKAKEREEKNHAIAAALSRPAAIGRERFTGW